MLQLPIIETSSVISISSAGSGSHDSRGGVVMIHIERVERMIVLVVVVHGECGLKVQRCRSSGTSRSA